MALALQIESLIAGLTDSSGRNLAGGYVKFFESDGTTAKTVWADSEKVATKTLNSDGGVDLDDRGVAEVYGDGVYIMKSYTIDDVLVDSFGAFQFNPSDPATAAVIDVSLFGSTNDAERISLAIADAAGADKTIYIPPANYDIDTNLTIPSNINARFEQGAYFTVAAGQTLTVNGVIQAPLYNILQGSGTITIENRNFFQPSVWESGTHDNATCDGVWTFQDIPVFQSGYSMSGGDITIHEAVNDGNPAIYLGAAAAERLEVQSVYDSAAQTLDYVQFDTKAASATADKGEYRFSVDETDIADINDSGINVKTGLAFYINDTSVLNATTLGSGVVASSLTSVGTLTSLAAGATTLSSTLDVSDLTTFIKDDAGVGVEHLRLNRTSDSPADNDTSYISFYSENDNNQQHEFARITSKSTDVSDGTEKGQWEFLVADGADGSMDSVATLDIDKLALATGLELGQYHNWKLVSKTTAYTAADETIILVDTTGGAVTITLPTAVGITGRQYTIVSIDDTNDVTVDGAGSETIGGATTRLITLKYAKLIIVSDGTNWQVMNNFLRENMKVIDEIILPINPAKSFTSTSYVRMFDYELSPLIRWPAALLDKYDIYLEYALSGGSSGNSEHAIRFIDASSNVRFDSGDISVGNQASDEMTWNTIDVKAGNSTDWDPTTELLAGINGNTAWEIQARADISAGGYSYYKMSLLLVDPSHALGGA